MSVLSCVEHPAACVTHGVGAVVGSVATSAFDDVAKEFASFAGDAVAWMWTQVDSKGTQVSFAGAHWNTTVAVTAAVGLVMLVGVFLLQVILSAARQDLAGLGRAWKGVVVATVGLALALSVAAILLQFVDDISSDTMSVLVGTNTWTEFGSRVVDAKTLTGGLLGAAAMLLTSMILLASTLVVWVALVIRKLLLIITAVMAPIAFAGAPFDVSRGMLRKWTEWMVALIFSKFLLVLLLGIGIQIEAGLGQAGTGTPQTISQLMLGVFAMAIAGLAPWIALMFVHWAGDGVQQVHQAHQAAHTGAYAATWAPRRMYAGAQNHHPNHQNNSNNGAGSSPQFAGNQVRSRPERGTESPGSRAGTGDGAAKDAGESLAEGAALI